MSTSQRENAGGPGNTWSLWSPAGKPHWEDSAKGGSYRRGSGRTRVYWLQASKYLGSTEGQRELKGTKGRMQSSRQHFVKIPHWVKGCGTRPEPWGREWLNSRYTVFGDKITKVADRLNWKQEWEERSQFDIRISVPNKQNYKNGQGLKHINLTLNNKCNVFLNSMSLEIFS